MKYAFLFNLYTSHLTGGKKISPRHCWYRPTIPDIQEVEPEGSKF